VSSHFWLFFFFKFGLLRETTGILDSNYILITSLTERIGYHEKAPVTANTSAALKDSCRSTRDENHQLPVESAGYRRLRKETLRDSVIDENIEDIDEKVPADLVGITIIRQRPMGIWIAELSKARHSVVMGGVHCFPADEAARYADSLVIGEAEEIIEGLFTTFSIVVWKRNIGRNNSITSMAYPLLLLIFSRRGRYSFSTSWKRPVAVLTTAKYCSVRQFWVVNFGSPSRRLSKELSPCLPVIFSFIDDNMLDIQSGQGTVWENDPLKRRWYGQGDIRVAHNPELLDLAARSGLQVDICRFWEH